MVDGRIAGRPLWRRSVPLSHESASNRISAYVYGNVLLLSALVLLSRSEVDNGRGAVLAAGTALSTFVAHVFAELLGSQAREVPHDTTTLLRDSVPVLTSATVPIVILILGWQDAFGPGLALRLAEAYIIVRIGLTSFILARLRDERASAKTFFASLGFAAIAAIIVVVKTELTH